MDALAADSIATVLKQAREQKGIALEQAAEALQIPQRYLQALEGEADRRLLADTMYLIPYLRTYATYLGFQADGAVRQFISELQTRDSSRLARAPESPLSPARFSAWVRPLALLLGVLIGGSFLVQLGSLWSWRPFGQHDSEGVVSSRSIVQSAPRTQPSALSVALPEEQGEKAAVSESEEPTQEELVTTDEKAAPITRSVANGPSRAAQEVVEPALPSALPPIAKAPAPLPTSPPAQVPFGVHQLQVEAVEKTWLRIVIDGEQTQDVMLSPNQKAQWEARDNFTLTVGNAGGIALTFDGTPLPSLGRSGEVVRRVRIPAVQE